MNPQIKTHLAQILASLAAIGSLLLGETPVAPETPAADKPKRGRPGKQTTEESVKPPAEQAETPKEEKPSEGLSVEELKSRIEPAVKAGMIEDVRKLIKKHGAEILKELPAANHAAFLKDVDALVI